MKRYAAVILSAGLSCLLSGCFGIFFPRPEGGPRPVPREETPREEAPRETNNGLVGAWEWTWRGDYGGYTSSQMIFRADGSYWYESMSYFYSSGGDMNTREEDAGTWSVNGSTIEYRSRSGKIEYSQFQLDPSGGAVRLGSQVWTRK